MEKQKTINRYDSHQSETKHTKITYGLTRAHANIWGRFKMLLLTICNNLRLTSCFSIIYVYLAVCIHFDYIISKSSFLALSTLNNS